MDIDDEGRKDLMEAFLDLQTEAETCIIELMAQWNIQQVHSLFRAIHNIKGNAGLMGVSAIVDFTHEVEEVAGALRQGKYKLSEPVAETLLLALDRLHDLHQQELYGKKFDYLRMDELRVLYRAMATATEQEADGIARQILHILGAGISEDDIDLFQVSQHSQPKVIEWLDEESKEEKLRQDLSFFQELALQIDNQLPSWEGRSIQLFDWAMKMNRLAGTPIDELQFAAAVYLHDLGMTLMPSELWRKKLDLNPKTCQPLALHPDWGYNYLVRIPGWEEAATIIHHHHECIDGSGYPAGLKENQIHAGAKILAILDTFFFLTNGRVDSSLRRSTMRAVSAINARVDTEFEGMWVQCFNHMIRKELKAGNV